MKPRCKMHGTRALLVHHLFEGFDMLHSPPACIIHEELGMELYLIIIILTRAKTMKVRINH